VQRYIWRFATPDESWPLPRATLAASLARPFIRRTLLAGIGLACAGSRAVADPVDLQRQEWADFQSRFVTPEGRVVDTGNGGISHSEGQGWALLFAVRADDQSGFERILGWTRRTLRRPGDELHSWRFRPNAAQPVDDPNNASDGDICIAWALLEAAERWGAAEHGAAGAAIGRDILRLLVRRAGTYSVLLPGAQGFEQSDHSIINPSYYVFPAFAALARAVPDPAWVRVAADGLMLLRASRFGRWGLPPDWAALSRKDGTLTLPPNMAPRFSYDAVRVPLYLAWAGLGSEPVMEQVRGFWSDPSHGFFPAWADLVSDRLSPYPASPGIKAVAQLATMRRSTAPDTSRHLPRAMAAPNYYSAALGLLVRLAWRDALETAV
jgi:endoglucanase